MTQALRFASILLLSAAGCGKAAQATRPDEATASEALGESAGRCTEDGRNGEANPLAIDLSAAERGMLEASMTAGVAVVQYDCEGLKLMRRCRVEGTYDYTAVSKKEAVIKMEDRASLEANFSGTAAQVPVDAAAGVEAGRALHLAYSVVGIESANLLQVFEGQLEGQCEGATHFVFGTAKGAFAMRTGSNTDTYTAAQLFDFAGANSSTSAAKDSATADGKLAACDTATPQDRASVPGCQALIRVELAPIDSGNGPVAGQSTPMTGRPDLRGCPDGFVYADGACLDRAKDVQTPFLCAPEEFRQCLEQCEAGSEGSCGRLGRIIGGQPGQAGGAVETWREYDTTANQAEIAALLPRLKSACEKGEGPACYAGTIAVLRRERSGGAAATGAEMAWFNERGCEAGDANSCYALVPRTSKPSAERLETWRSIGERSCRTGSPVACMYYGWGLAAVWRGLIPDIPSAAAALNRSCNGGVWEACVSGLLLTQDKATCDATVRDTSVKSDLFPTPGQFGSLDRICGFATADSSAATDFKARACLHGAPRSICS